MKSLRLLALFLPLLFLHAAPSRRAGITVREAQADFKIMHKLFAEAHATAFRQIPPGPAPELFKGDRPVQIRDFITQILTYYRGIHVDHTGLGFSPDLIAELDIKRAFFPYPLRFFRVELQPGVSGVRAFFDCETAEIPFASELLTIGGKSLATVLAELAAVAGMKNGQGEWDEFRLQENFAFVFYLRYGPQAAWTMEFRPPGEAALRTLSYRVAEIRNLQPILRRGANHPQLTQPLFTMFNPSVKGAYLAINTFMPAAGQLDSVDSWNNHLNLFHQEARLKKSEYLVIDLRLNRGGVMLFSAAAATWFIDRPLKDTSRSKAHTRVLPYKELVHALSGAPANETMLGEVENHLRTGFADKIVDGYFPTRNPEARHLELTPINVAHQFKKIYILTGPATYSAAVNFARLVKLGNKNTVLVGEETGSAGDGHSAEILVNYKLPGSGLLFEIPLMRVEFSPVVPGQKPERGLLPDIVVRDTIADFVASRDTVLEAASRAMVKP